MISSKDNPKLKLAQQLLRYKKKRNDLQRFVCDSKEACGHILRYYPQSIDYVLVEEKAASFLQGYKALDSEKVLMLQAGLLSQVSDLKQSFGLMLVCHMPKQSLTDTTFAMALMDINNPSNLGAIIRSCYAFDCKRLYLIGHCCDVYHPESVRASAGHLFDCDFMSLPVSELPSLFKQFNALTLKADAPQAISQYSFDQPTVFVMGSEQGFPDNPHLNAIPSLSIPMVAGCDSLNVGVAASIALYARYSRS